MPLYVDGLINCETCELHSVPTRQRQMKVLAPLDDWLIYPIREKVTVVRQNMRAVRGLPVRGQRGDYAADDLPAQEHPEVADAADRHGLHVGVCRHRPEARHNHVECGRER